MLNSKSFISLDFGAGSLKAAEFEVLSESGSLRLKQFAIKPLGLEGSQESAREGVILKALQELLSSGQFGAKNINVCAPGFHVFSKFVKLPPVDTSKVTQIIQYEAQQNVPFPLEEVVWDYQILGTTPTGELEVLLVAIKTDVVEGLFRTAEAAGLRLQLVDVSPAALCNAFRYNYGDLEGCTMLLDIGAKTSNLLFFEKGKVYSRGINIGANSITQDFAAEAKISFAAAEQAKISEGFVSLGGAYEEPDNPRQAQISKIARQVMTRLHIQVNQTMQFYRGQQGGSAPQRLFLAGGASIMPYTAQFFAEKLNVAVEYLNPFRNLQIDPSINLEDLARVAHSFGEVVGLGLRNLAQCPVEMNLMPKSFLKRQQFNQKKPYFIATVFSLVLVVFAAGWFYDKVASVRAEALATLTAKAQPLKDNEAKLAPEEAKIVKLKKESEQISAWMQDRFYWADMLVDLRRVLMETETSTKASLGVDAGVWIETFAPDNPETAAQAAVEEAPKNNMLAMDPVLAKRYGLTVTPPPTATAAAAKPSTNEISTIKVNIRAVNLKRFKPTANDDLAFALAKELRASPFFKSEEKDTHLGNNMEQVDDAALTFSFDLVLTLKRPVKL